MSIIDDFANIALHMNRKPDSVSPVVSAAAVVSWPTPEQRAAVRTLQALGYTYCDGAEMWKPPLGASVGLAQQSIIRQGGIGARAAAIARLEAAAAGGYKLPPHEVEKLWAIIGSPGVSS